MSHPIDDMVRGNPAAPHKAVLWISAEVWEVNRTGECVGGPKVRVEQFPVYIDAVDEYVATRRLNEFIDQVRAQCPAK